MIDYNFVLMSDVDDRLFQDIAGIFGLSFSLVKKELKPLFKGMKKKLLLVIEYPYVERYYRDTYYNFFSKKKRRYKRNSIRISFFADSITHNDFVNPISEDIENNFYGFITLRPTSNGLIGHSLISPMALVDCSFCSCICKKHITIYGHDVTIEGFPYSSQDKEATTCSESTIVNIVEYFANKYPDYSLLLPSDIHRILRNHSYERQIPSKGLSMDQISYVLKKCGFDIIVYKPKKKKLFEKHTLVFNKKELKDNILSYLESGIPCICSVISEKRNHTFILIGYQNFDIRKKTSMLVTMDTEEIPYEMVDIDKLLNDKYSDIDHIIVPLFSKVFVDAFSFSNLLEKIIIFLDIFDMNLPFNKKTSYCKKFLISSSQYRNNLSKQNELKTQILDVVLSIEMPKFIWVAEYLNDNKQVQWCIVVDSTETGSNRFLLFAYDHSQFIHYNDEKYEYELHSMEDSVVYPCSYKNKGMYYKQ